MPPSIDMHPLDCYPFQLLPRQLHTQFMPTAEYEDMNPIGLPMANTHNFLSTITPTMLALNQFDDPMAGEDGQRGCPATEGFLGARECGSYQLCSYERVPFAPYKKESISGRSSVISENDALDVNVASGFDSAATRTMCDTRSGTYSDLSSPMASGYASPMHDRALMMVLPSQQCPEPSTPQSATSVMLPMSLWGNSPTSTEDMLENISPFMTPMALLTSVSPTADPSSARAELALISPTTARTNRAKARKLQCNRHCGKHCDKDCGKLCRLPKVYSKKDDSHKCNKCDQRFKRQEHLKRHDRVHTGERPFDCQIPKCGKSFSRSDNFKEHMRTHRKQGGRNHYVPGLEI
ncbi:MAG: hypothetical protein M1839_004291 [Geoglossum umbratile]|nr:MAG: hypothetical protein M1839_004291 [Geoglossum umbratile]